MNTSAKDDAFSSKRPAQSLRCSHKPLRRAAFAKQRKKPCGKSMLKDNRPSSVAHTAVGWDGGLLEERIDMSWSTHIRIRKLRARATQSKICSGSSRYASMHMQTPNRIVLSVHLYM